MYGWTSTNTGCWAAKILIKFQNRDLDYNNGIFWANRVFYPLGKLAGRTIYFANAFFLFLFFNGQISRPGILKSNGPIFAKISGLVDGWKGLFTWYIILRSLRGRCYNNHLKLLIWGCSQTRQERAVLFALAFDNGLADREAFRRLNGNNPATPCTNLVTYRPIILKFTMLKRANFAQIRLQFDDWSSFVTLAFRNGLEDHNFDFRKVIGNHCCRNLVRFWSMTPEFKT